MVTLEAPGRSNEQRLLEGPYCADCFLAARCGSVNTSRSCPEPDYSPYFRQKLDNVLHLQHPDLLREWQRNLEFDFSQVSARIQRLPNLPPYFPTIEEPRKWLDSSKLDFVGITLKVVVSQSGKSVGAGRNKRSKLGLRDTAGLILLSFGEDQLLENLDAVRESTIPEIASLDYDIVTAMGYSVYDDDWPPETMNNQMRSLISFRLLQEGGATAIPFIAWADRLEMENWINWLTVNESITMIALDLQSCDDATKWERFIGEMKDFVDWLPDRSIEFLISGVARPDRVVSLKRLIGDFHLTNGYAYQMARVGQEDFGEETERRPARSTASKVDIFWNYCRFFESLMIGEASYYRPAGRKQPPNPPAGQFPLL